MGISVMFNKEYSQYYDLFNKKKPYKKEIEFVYKWAGKPKTIFDIGCGTANYWKYYPKETKLFGIDKSPAMSGETPGIVVGDVAKYKTERRFDCATALFDVLNYIPKHDWWHNIPVKKGGYYCFDIWDLEKINREGFKKTIKKVGNITRRITPVNWNEKSVDLMIDVLCEDKLFQEKHKMYLYSDADIEVFCGNEFVIIDTKQTKTWQKWYLLKKE